MRAEVISIGDELTSGQRLDTNSQWLSQRLGEIGIPVLFHTTVGDDLEANIAVFRAAIDRADVVVCTGGLGPTADDLTRDALAAAAGVELYEDAAALAHIQNLFARRKRAMPERNILQALFPRGSRVVPNPEGTAPGIDFSVSRNGRPPCRVFALPGVPAEMVTMWNESVGPALAADRPSSRVICHRRIKCFGVGESDLEAMLPDMIRREREPLVGITVHGATITLRITTSGPNEVVCREAMEPTVAEILSHLGVLVFGEEDDELEHAVLRLLEERGKTLGVAEWATDGLVSRWLAEAAEAFPLPKGKGSDCFRGGIVVRDLAMLPSFLGAEASANAATQVETAAAMASAVRRASGADYGLGIAALPSHAEDALHVALASGDNTRTKAFPVASHPAIIKIRSAKLALNMVRLALLNSDGK
jgi:nicotinamide-nucleotide amidase